MFIMRKYTVLIFTSLILFLSNLMHAQNDDKSWVFGAGFNIVDIRVPSEFGEIVKDYLNGDIEDLNYYGAPLRLSAEKDLNKGLSVQMAGSLNKIKRGFLPNTTTLDEANFVNLDAKLKYALSKAINREGGWFDPYVGLGIGFSFLKDYPSGNDFKLGAGGGFNAWLKPNFGLSFDSYYHHNFKKGSDGNPTGTDFFQHAIGVVFKPRLGIKDTDGDNIKDRNDKCPKTYGVAEYDGCPIQDSDRDGVADAEDKCPNEVGPIDNDGCPIRDTDGDGVMDNDDACPTEFGALANNGCPEKVTEIKTPVVVEAIVFPTMTFYFDRDSHEVKNEETINFKNAVYLMKYSDDRFLIRGHTEGAVTSLYHQLLSGKRVAAVVEYLVSQGVTRDKLVLTNAYDDNLTSEDTGNTGGENNRRVTVSIIE